MSYVIIVTISGKTRHIVTFVKIAIMIYLSSITFELTLHRSPAPFVGYMHPLSDHVRTIKLEKLRSKGVAMRAHPISVYYKYTEIACERGLSI